MYPEDKDVSQNWLLWKWFLEAKVFQIFNYRLPRHKILKVFLKQKFDKDWKMLQCAGCYKKKCQLTGFGGKSGSRSELWRNNWVAVLFRKSSAPEPEQASQGPTLSTSLDNWEGVARPNFSEESPMTLDMWSILLTFQDRK